MTLKTALTRVNEHNFFVVAWILIRFYFFYRNWKFNRSSLVALDEMPESFEPIEMADIDDDDDGGEDDSDSLYTKITKQTNNKSNSIERKNFQF